MALLLLQTYCNMAHLKINANKPRCDSLGVIKISLLLGGCVDKFPSRLATSVKLVLLALTPENTKAGGLQLSRARLFRPTFDIISHAMPTNLASQIMEVIRG